MSTKNPTGNPYYNKALDTIVGKPDCGEVSLKLFSIQLLYHFELIATFDLWAHLASRFDI
jgi:hypothetical protein